ncbi:MAG TPA: EscU/YscU/HrcU family type III secretion system export apparatus switch protein [Clostridia bacterium]|nr:EscU/YscU/HrcU family type III secretion system export apparatus switch protein [Clostridia bacterium]
MDDKRVKKVAALKYTDKDIAPNILAVGKGIVADKIIKTALESGIPLVQSPEVIEDLSKLHIGNPIPPELYQAVGEIYAFLIKMDRDMEKE